MASRLSGPRPRIGVTSSAKHGLFMWWCNRFAIWRAGGRAVRLAPGKTTAPEGLDGFVVGGGDDIVPTLYGGQIDPAVRIDPERDALELAVLAHAFARALPVLGICRGAQMINVARGGSLHQDIYQAFEGVRRMRTVLPRKRVAVDPRSRLALLLGEGPCRVNALHSQAVDRLGAGLAAVARDEHGIVQAVEDADGPFLIGVQWHPEFLLFDRGQQALFRALVRAARVRRAAGPESEEVSTAAQVALEAFDSGGTG